MLWVRRFLILILCQLLEVQALRLVHSRHLYKLCNMHEFHLDTIGTHLRILIDTSSPIGEDFSHIEARLSDFEKKFSRFIEGNWLANLNISRTGTLDDDTQVMLGMMLDLSEKSGGYFDPTV